MAAEQQPAVREPRAVLREAIERHYPKIKLACSFQAESYVLIDMVMSIRRDVPVFSLDTGRLPEETYEVAQRISDRYGIEIEWYFPKQDDVERMVREKGMFSFRDSVENRKQCCGIRKVEPLNRALAGMTAWITGLRREHAESRTLALQVESDTKHGVEKINPVVHWSTQDVWDYIESRDLPYNALYDHGYQSIGCSPCTTPVRPGEHPRAGRWRWEQAAHKECGLHDAGSGI